MERGGIESSLFSLSEGLRDQRGLLPPEKLHQLAKLIFKKYLRDSEGVLTALLPADVKRTIHRKLTNKRQTHEIDGGVGSGQSEAVGSACRPGQSDAGIFDEAQVEVFSFLSSEPYFTFLKGEAYLSYLRSAMTTTTTRECGASDDDDASVTSTSSTSSSNVTSRPISQR